MQVIKTSSNGINYLKTLLKQKQTVFSRAMLWRITHSSRESDISLKIGRYKKSEFWDLDMLESDNPKSELTLDSEELNKLIEFISENYAPLKDGIKKYIPIDESFDQNSVEHIKAIFENPDKSKLVSFILENNILPEDLILDLGHRKRLDAIKEFESMLLEDLRESDWQTWFKENPWVLGTEFVSILDERDIDTEHISDYLMEAYDGFVDIVEIKRPDGGLKFWSTTIDHGNYFVSSDLTRAIAQSARYIYEIEREANSVKFLERVGNVKTVKPRCVLVFGRSADWCTEQKEAYRILNSSYHNITIMTYDHVLARAKRILGIDGEKAGDQPTRIIDKNTNLGNTPF
jgi:hypothetical protein